MTSEPSAAGIPSPPVSPWQQLYGAAHRARRSWYRRRAARLPRPVLSIGNLHWGGTGKTPLVAAVATWLRDHGRNVAILSRGYGGRKRGVRIVSTGSGPLLGPLAAGDEPVLLASELPGVSVVVGPDRYQAGNQAIERLPVAPDLFVLDDGFSHVRLFRDLDILVFPAVNPLVGGRLPPLGKLREPLESVRHADALLWSESDDRDSGNDASTLAEGLREYGFKGPGFDCYTEVLAAKMERDESLPEGARVFVVIGVARPERVLQTLETLSYRVAGTITFPDHHTYPKESLRRIENQWRDSGADWVLTTGKDHVKLLGRLEAPLAHLPIRTRPQERFWVWLASKLESLESHR